MVRGRVRGSSMCRAYLYIDNAFPHFQSHHRFPWSGPVTGSPLGKSTHNLHISYTGRMYQLSQNNFRNSNRIEMSHYINASVKENFGKNMAPRTFYLDRLPMESSEVPLIRGSVCRMWSAATSLDRENSVFSLILWPSHVSTTHVSFVSLKDGL